jgi:hypothetical protein
MSRNGGARSETSSYSELEGIFKAEGRVEWDLEPLVRTLYTIYIGAVGSIIESINIWNSFLIH